MTYRMEKAAVLAWVDAGYSIFPVGQRKEPAGNRWTGGPEALAQTNPATIDEARDMAARYQGIAAAAGTASGNVEMFEVEGRAVTEGYADRLREAMRDHGREDLLDRLLAGCVARSPSGGFHIWFRTEGPPLGNRKLARRPLKPEEETALQASLAEQGRTEAEIDRIAARAYETLIETRGQGGYAVLPPSGGIVHPDGGAWMLLPGTSPAATPILTTEDRDFLYGVAGLLDEIPDPTEHAPSLQSVGSTEPRDGKRPGDDFEERATWEEILEPAGWQKGRRLHGDGQGWVRPGKELRDGISGAVVNLRIGRRFVPYSSSTFLEPFKQYSKFSLYAALEHDGDFSDASRALRKLGYGDPDRPRDSAADLRGLIADVPQPTDGNLAVVRELKPAKRKPSTYTDAGNADLMVDEHANHLRYVPSRGAWLTWARTHWAWCEDDGEALQAAIDTIKTVDTSDDDAYKHQIKSLSRRSLEAMVAIARRHTAMRVPSDALDADTYALNTPLGVVDLRDGTLRAHDPAEMHTKVTGATYRPDATPDRWLTFLRDTFGGDEEMVTFVQRLAGYSACGIVLHHVLPFLHGAGGNGKSVFLDVIVSVLGDYASTAPSGFLMAGGREDENAVARLAGLRLIVCSEVNQAARFDEAKVKLLTGGDKLTARFLYQRHFTFKPTHTLWLMGNHQPRVDAGGESFWRRLRLLPFTRIVPKEKRIEGLADQLLQAEADAILTWIIQGAQDVLRDGLREPAAVLTATSVYAEEEDALARFMDDRCHIGGGEHTRVDTRDLRAAYERWCSDEGGKPVSPQVFGRELRTRFGIDTARSHGRRYYVGVTLLSNDDEPAESHWSDR